MTTDAIAPLVFKGTFCVNAGAGLVDVSNELSHAMLKFVVDTVSVPATLGQPKSNRGGGVMAMLELGWLATDGSAGVLYGLMLAAAATATKTLDFYLKMRDGVESVSNPAWSGTFVVAVAELGGTAETLSATSPSSYNLTDMPTLNEA